MNQPNLGLSNLTPGKISIDISMERPKKGAF